MVTATNYLGIDLIYDGITKEDKLETLDKALKAMQEMISAGMYEGKSNSVTMLGVCKMVILTVHLNGLHFTPTNEELNDWWKKLETK